MAEAIKATLIKDGTIDGAITISAGDADSASIGILQAGKTSSVALGSFDMNGAVLDRISDGTQAFAIDQRPYLQGLLATQFVASAVDFGTDLPTFPVLTGPGIVDASNIGATMAGVEITDLMAGGEAMAELEASVEVQNNHLPPNNR